MASQNKRLEITITGDEKDAVRALRALGGETEKADKSTSKLSSGFDSMGLSSAAVFGGIAAGAAAGAYALYEVGSTFDGVFDQFATATGKTGDDLAALEDSFRTVFASGPAAAEDVGNAMTKLSVGLGLTGEELEGVSKQLLDLARITDADVVATVDGATKALQNFAIPAGDQAEVLNELFRVTQATGISFEELAASLGDNGVALRSAGLDIDEAAAFLGTLEKAGIDASDVMPALTKALNNSAKAGIDAEDAIKNTFAAIAMAPNDIAAAQIAVDMFGKSGATMATSIREGKLSYDELLASIQSGTTIEDEAAATADFSEKWETFKNKMLVAFEPAATAVFEKLGQAMDWLTVEGIPRFQDGWSKFMVGWDELGRRFDVLVTRFKDGWQGIMDGFRFLRDEWDKGIESWSSGWESFTSRFASGWDRITGLVSMFGENFGRGIEVIETKANELLNFINGIPGRVWDIGSSIASSIVDGFKSAWNAAAKYINYIIPAEVNIGIGPAIKLPMGGDPLPRFHNGGVVPGRPGQEVPAILQAGEVVYTAAQAARGGGGGGLSVVVNMGIVGDPAEAGRQIVATVEKYIDGGGSARFAA